MTLEGFMSLEPVRSKKCDWIFMGHPVQAVEHTYPLIEPFQNLRKKTKEEKLREGKYQNLVFRRFSDVISFSVFYNHRGWHCSVCKHVAKKGSKLKKHYLQKHRFEKKIFV